MKITQPKIITRGCKLYISFSIDGKQTRKSLNLEDTKANRALVQNQIIPQLLLKIHSGEFFENKNMPTVDTYSLISFENHKYERKPTTNKDYANIYKKHISPHFGDKKLNEIKVSDINKWKNILLEELGLGSSRINDIKKIFGTILEDALIDEIIDKNPVRKSKPLAPTQRKEIHPFSLDEIKSILNHAQGQDKNIIATLFFTGMRTGELIGLMWDDIDFAKKTISIKRTIGRGVIGTPKTNSSIRVIPISNALLSYLLEQKDITKKHNSYVFLNNKLSHFFDAKNIRGGLWKKVLKKAKVTYRTVYQTRHTFCSLNLQKGTDLILVSTMMGVKNPKITLERYSKYIPVAHNYSSVFDEVAEKLVQN